MWFDAQKALAEIERGHMPLSSVPLPAAQSRAIRPGVAVVANVATRSVHKPQKERPVRRDTPTGATFPHGLSCAGHPLTWTGRIVSLNDWWRLTKWERHGSHGLLWNGITQRWEQNESEQK